MFRRIELIADAAVWSGYDARRSRAPDFERYNLIYGWNASGKTTLSRVFGLLAASGGGAASGRCARPNEHGAGRPR